MGGFLREEFRSALQGNAKLMVIDPKRIDIAKRADVWLCPRPQSDGVLALGMIKVIIEEGLYDREFVENWTVGFDKLRDHVRTFSLDDVERLTWVPHRKIEDAARLFGRIRPVSLVVGNGIERAQHAFQTLRAVFILRALVGDINTPGGNVCLTPGEFTRMGRFYLVGKSPRRKELYNSVAKEHPITISSAYIPTQSLVKAILDEKPYPIKGVLCFLTDPLVSYPDTEQTYKAFMKLEFIAISEIFPTPTTQIADIVLPAAWGAEHVAMGHWPGWHEEVRVYEKLVDPPGEARADTDWINDLAGRLGLGEQFWEDEMGAFKELLAPSGLSWEQFRKKRCIEATKEYKKPEEGIFKTKSGKIDIFSQPLMDIGCSPMPLFEEVCRFRFAESDDFPLLLLNAKEGPYMLTGYKHVEFLKRMRPEPTVELNPETAKRYGVTEGEWIWIETKKGRIKQLLVLDADLDPRLVNASFGWWFPHEKDMLGFRKSNINILTDADPPYDPDTGSVELGGIPCRVYKN